MKFGSVPVSEAAGAIAAHSTRAGARVIRKGARLGADDVADLEAAGVDEIVVARLDAGDVHEDEAARRLGTLLAADGTAIYAADAATGRVNLFAAVAGVVAPDRAVIDALNRVDPAITVATLAEDAAVRAGQMVATVKIIPYAVPETAVRSAEGLLAGQGGLRVAPFRALRVGLLQTELPAVKPSVLDKTRRVLERRLQLSGAAVVVEKRVVHEPGALAGALAEVARVADLAVAFGASAVVDDRDVVPAAVRAAGGTVLHVGMPVDPGNLLLLGAIGPMPVIGAPGCARSPRENGFDWVLNRMLAGLEVTPHFITGLGVGGLMMEIDSRPMPREAAAGPKVAAVILAAGRSSRMGGPNKMLATLDGRPLVRIAAEAALASKASLVTVVAGHQAAAVGEALSGLAVRVVANPDFAQGLSTSLRVGIGAVGDGADAAVVMLGDMPFVTAEVIDRLIAAYRPEAGALVVVPTADGQQGNPVLWDRRFFPELTGLSGDSGAKRLLGVHGDFVTTVEVGGAALRDVDTPEALAAADVRLPAE